MLIRVASIVDTEDYRVKVSKRPTQTPVSHPTCLGKEHLTNGASVFNSASLMDIFIRSTFLYYGRCQWVFISHLAVQLFMSCGHFFKT